MGCRIPALSMPPFPRLEDGVRPCAHAHSQAVSEVKALSPYPLCSQTAQRDSEVRSNYIEPGGVQ